MQHLHSSLLASERIRVLATYGINCVLCCPAQRKNLKLTRIKEHNEHLIRRSTCFLQAE